MKQLLTLAVFFISATALADPCGPNCISFKLNNDLYSDKVEFVVGIQKEGQSSAIHALNLKVSVSYQKTKIVAHDSNQYNQYKSIYTTITDAAYVGKLWSLKIDEKTKIATLSWHTDDSQGSLITTRYQLNADGSAKLLK